MRILKLALPLFLLVVASSAAAPGRETAAEQGGFLFVDSQPQGIDVLIDGKDAGRTPLTLDLPAGRHKVTWTSASHDDVTREVVLEEGRVARAEETMTLAETSLTVTTDIPDARVFVDGAEKGKWEGGRWLARGAAGYESSWLGVSAAVATDRELTLGLVVGTHLLVLRALFAEFQREVVLLKGEPARLDFPRASLLGAVSVVTDAARGGLFVDGWAVPGTTPMTIDLVAGEHTLSFGCGQLSAGKCRLAQAATVTVRAGEAAVARAFGHLEKSADLKILFQSDRDGRSHAYAMNSDGTYQTRLTDDIMDERFPSWSPDGENIAFVSGTGTLADVYLVHPDGTAKAQITWDSAEELGPFWSPDGTKIGWWSDADADWAIYVRNIDGSGRARLAVNFALDCFPSWSPDGSKIAFCSFRDGNYQIYVMNPDGTRQTRLTRNQSDDLRPSWSPDGRKIAFMSDRDGNSEIYVMDSTGRNQVNVTDNPADDILPTWSPEGTRIAFVSNRDGNQGIYVMDADGTNQTRLTNNAWTDTCPSWSPPF
jgi:Tol biopolymer transport system component